MFKPDSKIEMKVINMISDILSHHNANDIKTYNIIAQCIINRFNFQKTKLKNKNYLKIFEKIKQKMIKDKEKNNNNHELYKRIAKRTLRNINPVNIDNCFFCHINDNQKWSKYKNVDFIYNDYIFFK